MDNATTNTRTYRFNLFATSKPHQYVFNDLNTQAVPKNNFVNNINFEASELLYNSKKYE